jgi:hypothetical protein
MKLLKALSIFIFVTWSTIGFCLNLSVFEGTFKYTGSNRDPKSAPCPYKLIVKQTLSNSNEIINLNFYGVDYASNEVTLIQSVDRYSINPEDDFYKTPKQSMVKFGGVFEWFSGTMVINDDGQPNHNKYVYINIKKQISYNSHLDCGYLY